MHPYCKECNSSISAEWRAKNRDRIKAKDAARYIAKCDHIKAMSLAWYYANRERAIAKQAAWYASNKDKAAIYNARKRALRPEICRIYHQNRRARIRSNGGKLSIGLAERLFKLQRGKCACCGKPLGTDYHLDHIMPLALGGTNEDKNIQLLRATCNLSKQHKHPIEFMQKRGFLL